MSKDINKHIKERGWNDMNILLDKHMPTKNKNKWLPWLGVGVFLLMLGGYWMDSSNDETDHDKLLNQNELKHQEPIASLFNRVDLNTISTKTQSISSHKSYNENKIIKHIDGKRINHHQLETTTRDHQNSTPSKRNLIAKISINTLTNFVTRSNDIEVRPSCQNDEAHQELWIKNSRGIASINRQNEVTLTIPTLLTSVSSSSEDKVVVNPQQFLNLGTKISFLESKSKWGLIAGFFSDNFQALNGGHFGFFRSTALSKKIDVTYGISVDAMVKSGFEDVINSSDNSYFFNLSVGGDNSKSINSITPLEKNSSYNAIAKSVDQLYYANIPVHLNYWLLPRLGINIGVNISYLLYGTNFSSIRSTNNNFEGVDDEYLFTHRLLNRLDLGIEAGLTYKISPKFNTNMTYRHGVSQVLRKSQYYDRVDYNRTFDFSLEYML